MAEVARLSGGSMRVWSVLAVALLGGCDFSIDLSGTDWSGEDWGSTAPAASSPAMEDGFLGFENGMNGFAVSGVHVASGDWLVAGMSGLTCQVQMASASFITDNDVTDGNDTVEDGATDEDGHVVVLVSNRQEIDVVRLPDDMYGQAVTSAVVNIAGRVASERTFDGFASLTDDDGCALQWFDLQGTAFASQGLRQAYCDVVAGQDSFDMDLAGDVAWIGSDSGVAIATTQGVTEVAVPADIVAWDSTAGVTYTAQVGSSLVTAIEPSGTTRWATDLLRPVEGLDDMAGMAAVSVDRDDGNTDIVVLDGVTGAVLDSQGVAREAGPVVVSADGASLVLPRDSTFDFFAVGDVGGE
jgi:hypothetical protein